MNLFKKTLAAGLVCLAGVLTASAQTPDLQAAFADVRYAPVRAELPEGEKASDRLLDIYLPSSAKPEAGYPVLVFIHGGGFSGGDKELKGSNAGIYSNLVEHGYACVSLNYFLARKIFGKDRQGQGVSHGSGLDYAVEDAVLALQYLDKHAAEYSLDMDRLAIMGGSAGSMTCLTTAFSKHLDHPKVRAVVNCWGSLRNLEDIKDGSVPVLTIHGDQDKTVKYQNALNIQARMKEVGCTRSRLITLEGLGHAQYRYVGENLMGEVNAFLDEALRSDLNVFQNVRYGEKRSELKVNDPTQDRLLDLYIPSTVKPEGGYPVFVFVHGGGFSGGNKDMKRTVEAMFTHLLEKGYAVASLNYFLFKKNNPIAKPYTPASPLPETLASEDVVLALRWIWDHAAQYGLDRNKVALCGGSAGGATVLSTAYMRQPVKPSVKAIVDLWGGISNLELIQDPSIPILIIFGDQDRGFATQAQLKEQMEKIGNPYCETIVMEGKGHAEYRYVGENLMDRVTDFLDRSLALVNKQ